MKNRYVAIVAAAALLAGAGGAYTYTRHETAPRARMVAASAPLDPAARDLSGYKGKASAKGQAKHAAATRARQEAAQRARDGYERSTDPADGDWTPRTPVGQPCDGDPSSYHVTQPDGTCSGPTHRTNQLYFDDNGDPCVPGDRPCDSDSRDCPEAAGPGCGDPETHGYADQWARDQAESAGQ